MASELTTGGGDLVVVVVRLAFLAVGEEEDLREPRGCAPFLVRDAVVVEARIVTGLAWRWNDGETARYACILRGLDVVAVALGVVVVVVVVVLDDGLVGVSVGDVERSCITVLRMSSISSSSMDPQAANGDDGDDGLDVPCRGEMALGSDLFLVVVNLAACSCCSAC